VTAVIGNVFPHRLQNVSFCADRFIQLVLKSNEVIVTLCSERFELPRCYLYQLRENCVGLSLQSRTFGALMADDGPSKRKLISRLSFLPPGTNFAGDSLR